MKGRVTLAFMALAIALVATGSGETVGERAKAAEGPAYGLVSSGRADEGQTLMRLDPRTLAPLGGRSLHLRDGLGLGGRSPDGRFAAFLDSRRASVHVVDLETMRFRADVRLSPDSRSRVRAAAWLTADRVAVVVQRMRGAYNQIVESREAVLIDPLAGRVVTRQPLPSESALQLSANGGDKLVLMLGRGDRRDASRQLAVIDSAGAVRIAAVDLQGGEGLRVPSLVVEPSGRRAFLVAAGEPVVELDLETMQISARPVRGATTVFAPAPLASRQAVWLNDRTLAVTGSNHERVDGVETSRPAGLALVDTTTWQARLIDRAASGVSHSAGTLLSYGTRIESAGRRGRPAQRLVGIGLRAYEVDGARRWQGFPGQALAASAFRQIALVYRRGRLTASESFVVDLASGRQVRGVRLGNFWVLPDAPAAAGVRRVAGSDRDEPAVELTGDGDSFTGSARNDVSRVVAVLVDGSEQDIPLSEAGFDYRATSPERSARLVRAYAGEQLLATVALDVRCGGSAGPCGASALRVAPQGQDDPLARVSNRGTRVRAKAENRRAREFAPRDLFLLRRDEAQAVYRVGGARKDYNACYAAGPGDDVGRIGQIGCGRSRFPSRALPIYDMSSSQMQRRDRSTRRLFRVMGVAADGVAEIGMLDEGGDVVVRVPVEDNVYLLGSPPAEAAGPLVAYDGQGRIVYRSDRREAPVQRPATPGRLAGFRLRLTLPEGWRGEIERSSAGPARALVTAGNRLPARNPRTVSLMLVERDPRERPAFPHVSEPPRVSASDVRPVGRRYGRAERRFTLNGRQFRLQLSFGTPRPSASVLAEVNGVLGSLEVGAIAVPAGVPDGTPLQRGSADGVSVDVYRSGIVVFRISPASRVSRLRGGEAGFGCLTFDSVSPWEPNEWGASKRLRAMVQFTLSEATRPELPWATIDPATAPEPPFDGCVISGSYGRRWNDSRGQHSPAEIAFTARGRRFFDERAVARDLALFVRTPAVRAARTGMKRGGSAPSASAVTRGLPARVVELSSRRGRLPAGRIGVWSNRRDTIEVSAFSAAGKRLFVELRGGRISRHNLEGLAFVF